MRNAHALLTVPALAALAATGSAQFSNMTDLSGTVLRLTTAEVLQQPGQGGIGTGFWYGPTHMELGHGFGSMVSDAGRPAYQLDMSMTRYVMLGAGLQYGAVYGVLTPEGDGMPLVLQGEWSRPGGQFGEMHALILEPTGGLPSVRVVGAVSGRIRFDEWTRSNPFDAFVDMRDQALERSVRDASSSAAQPSTGSSSSGASIDSVSIDRAPSAAVLYHEDLPELIEDPVGLSAPSSSYRATVERAPTASPMSRDSIAELDLQSSPAAGRGNGRGPSNGNGQGRADAQRITVAENLRGSLAPRGGTTEMLKATTAGRLSGDAKLERLGGAYGNLRDQVVELEEPVGTDFTLDPERSGEFMITYRLLR